MPEPQHAGRRRADGAEHSSHAAGPFHPGHSRGAWEGLAWMAIAAMGVAAIAYVGWGTHEIGRALSAPDGGIQRAMRAIDGPPPVQGAARDPNLNGGAPSEPRRAQ